MSAPIPRPARIRGTGKALPRRVVTSAELEDRLKLPAGSIEARTGVMERRFVTDETASQLGATAAQRALEAAGATLSDVDLVVCAAGSSEQTIPCTAVLIQRQLGPRAAGIPCFDVNATCLSFLVGMDVATALIASGSHRGILVVSPEVSSPALDWTESESCVLLGDGAAAVFVTPAESHQASSFFAGRMQTFSQGAELARVLGGGTRYHPNAAHTRPEMNLFHMEGLRIFKFAQPRMVRLMESYLGDLDVPAETLRAVVPHQASLPAMRLTARACGFSPEQMIENIQDHGNCIAASIPLALHDGIASGRIRRDDRVLLGGTAAGVSVGAMVFTY